MTLTFKPQSLVELHRYPTKLMIFFLVKAALCAFRWLSPSDLALNGDASNSLLELIATRLVVRVLHENLPTNSHYV
jgi:hypothetical protein